MFIDVYNTYIYYILYIYLYRYLDETNMWDLGLLAVFGVAIGKPLGGGGPPSQHRDNHWAEGVPPVKTTKSIGRRGSPQSIF